VLNVFLQKQNLEKYRDFSSCKRKVVQNGKFDYQSGGFMLYTRSQSVKLDV
jgi:hypothetical protein